MLSEEQLAELERFRVSGGNAHWLVSWGTRVRHSYVSVSVDCESEQAAMQVMGYIDDVRERFGFVLGHLTQATRDLAAARAELEQLRGVFGDLMQDDERLRLAYERGVADCLREEQEAVGRLLRGDPSRPRPRGVLDPGGDQ